MVELSSPIEEDPHSKWAMSVNDASNVKGSMEGIILEGSRDIAIELALNFKFIPNNNKANYEAIITGMFIAFKMEATRLKAKSDS